MRELRIGSVRIDDASDAFVIAEIGHNHQGDIAQAKRLFVAAREAGVHAVKLQKRENRTLFTRAYFDRPYDNENSFGPTYGLHREALEFNEGQYRELQQFAIELGLEFFATAFDVPSADFLARLGVPAIKIASGDIKNTPLLRYVASLGIPLVVSTGAATLEDVKRANEAIAPVNRSFALLQCTAVYPAPFEELDLAVIPEYRRMFPDTVIGYSGHDNGIAMPVVAYVLGARIIEKHFTLNRAMKGTDHAFSLEPVGMRKMVRDLVRTRVALGDGQKKSHASEAAAAVKMGKKLVAARDLQPGHVLLADDIAIRSPGDGVPPYEIDRIIGRRTRVAIPADEDLAFERLDPSS